MSLESIFKLSLVMNLVDRLSGPMAGVASKVGADVSRLDALSQTFGNFAKAGAVMQEAGSQITGAVLAPVEATFETQRALGELSSLGVKDLDALEGAARKFSDQWSGTTKADFISAAYDIKSGISTLSDEGVAEFTGLAALTAKATKATAAEMTSLFASGYGIYKNYYSDLSDIQFGEMFSAGIAESVRAFKTSGSGMAQGIQSLGASATTANVPLEEQLAILGMLQATMGGAEAGTKYKAFLRSAAKGGEALGLSFLDANNQLLSMPEILGQLRGKFGETMDAAEKMELQKAFGDAEAVALIDLLYSKTGDLQDNILNLYGAMGQGTSVAQDMASAIQETEPERFARLQQRIHNVVESIGGSLLPTVNDLMGKGEQVLTKVASWIEGNQELVRVIMLTVLAVGGFLAIGGTVITVISGVGLAVTKTVSTFKMLRSGFFLVKGALGPLTGSVWSFTAALLANPVTWVVIGIVALIAALVLLYNKCEWFREGVGAILDFFGGSLQAGLDLAGNILGALGGLIGGGLEAANAAVREKLGNMKRTYEEHGGGIRGIAAVTMEGVTSIFGAGFNLLDRLTGGKLGGLRAAYEEHGGGIQGITAAAVEGVKGYYSAGFTFLDNLTGGKLSEISGKFTVAMGGFPRSAREKFAEVQAAFANGLDGVKNTVTGAVTWFFDSGRKIVSTFANGIRSAFSGAVDAVRGGLQRIRNFLPFSDAKEGPLSTLTLSGQRTMTTYAHGLALAQDAPAAAMEQGLQKASAALEYEPVKKVGFGNSSSWEDDGGEENAHKGENRQVIIQKLIMQVDLKKIKDLQMLLSLLREVEDYSNGNGDADPETIPSTV
ncbi:phage tail tape measure protein [uncultured Oscillibacter sp.]|uniref:phage tail tape measure protein n=1 Tax=uncultured Oscillibacter sp. TaxID=876091 RepID=UPI0025FAE3C2|nr:phage tail tape measure protein [uncultured Oscillibacter sp.]